MADFLYTLAYAGVPFLLDKGQVFRAPPPVDNAWERGNVMPPGKFQPEPDIVDELDRLLPWRFLQDFTLPPNYPGRNLGGIACQAQVGPDPSPDQLRIGDWYYPNTARKWGIFRGLASSRMAKAMLLATGGKSPATFVMKAAPVSPNNPGGLASKYTLTTSMYMLPPRPLAEHGGGTDGLYLITLVDERYYFQGSPVTPRVTKDTTWASLIELLGGALGVTILYSTIDPAYGQPEPDSQLWCNAENAAILLDAVAYNLGRVVVRSLAGGYTLMTADESRAVIQLNRGDAGKVVRTAGGDIFYSGTRLPAGDLSKSRNSVVPSSITVSFPKYVRGDDPVPHFLNPRTTPQTPSQWYQESYGETHQIVVPIASGGPNVSGLMGTSNDFIHTTAKALLSSESSGAPLNASGLTALALRLARDYYDGQAGAALDEVYPGTLAWTPEGAHDVIWTYSARARQACTRVMRAEWNNTVDEFQHSAVALSGYTNTPKGVGGPLVAQTWRDSDNSVATGYVSGNMAATDLTVVINSGTGLPADARWRGQVDNEVILFEAAQSGGTYGVVAYRGIDGTIPARHSGALISQIVPNVAYGVNLVTVQGASIRQGAWTSGGVVEAVLKVTAAGSVGSGGVGSGSIASGAVVSGNIASGVINTYNIASGTLQWWNLAPCYLSGANCSGVINFNSFFIASGAIQYWMFASGSLLSGGSSTTLDGARVYLGAGVGSSGNRIIPFDTSHYDTGSPAYVNVGNKQYFTAPKTGKYHIGAQVGITAGGGTVFMFEGQIVVNSGTIVARQRDWTPGLGSSGLMYVNCNLDYPLNSGDIVHTVVNHDGVSRTLETTTPTAMWIHYLFA